jgi:DNA-binding transcriptional MerR regulator
MSAENANSGMTYRIGAVAKLAGVPVTTLRVWETRYQAFVPQKSDGKHRMYLDADVRKATLLKRLSDEGHAIGSIANLDVPALQRLHQQAQSASAMSAQKTLEANTVSMAVVGVGLASRIESKKFTLSFLSNTIRVTDVFFDLAAARVSSLSEQPHILLIKVTSVQEATRAEIVQLIAQHRVQQGIVLYNYGQERVVESLRREGLIVRREPISDFELSDLISSVLLIDAAKSVSGSDAGQGSMIPPRKYSEQTLMQVARISTNVLCECPRHVAEMITQLASFEEYSQECLNRNNEDAHLHAYLSSISGSARALFERALEMLAAHEGIDISPMEADASRARNDSGD